MPPALRRTAKAPQVRAEVAMRASRFRVRQKVVPIRSAGLFVRRVQQLSPGCSRPSRGRRRSCRERTPAFRVFHPMWCASRRVMFVRKFSGPIPAAAPTRAVPGPVVLRVSWRTGRTIPGSLSRKSELLFSSPSKGAHRVTGAVVAWSPKQARIAVDRVHISSNAPKMPGCPP